MQPEAEEIKRRREEEERLKLEISIRRDNCDQLIAELKRQGGAWYRRDSCSAICVPCAEPRARAKSKAPSGRSKSISYSGPRSTSPSSIPYPRLPQTPTGSATVRPLWEFRRAGSQKNYWFAFSAATANRPGSSTPRNQPLMPIPKSSRPNLARL
jgi:hypothetical protein